MKNKLFSNSVYSNLKESNSFSLKLLLEEEKEEDIFAALDEPEEDPEEEAESGEEPGAESEEEPGDESEIVPEEEESVTKEQFDKLLDDLEMIKSYILGTRDIEGDGTQDGTSSIESYIGSAVSVSEVAESFIVKNIDLIKEKYMKSFKSFLLEDESKDVVDAVEAEIDDLDRVLTKGTDVVDKFKKGRELNIEKYVNVAINAFRNFDSLFSKESIVKQATINVLVLNSGAKADQNIGEFKKRFHEELSSQFGIDYEDEVLDVESKNTAAGAKSQG